MKKVLWLSLVLLLVVGCSYKKENTDQNNNEVDYSQYINSDSTLDNVVEKNVSLDAKEHKLTFIYSYNVKESDEGSDGYYYVSVLLDNKIISSDLISKEIANDDMEDNDIENFKSTFLSKVKKDFLISDDDINLVKDSDNNDIIALNLYNMFIYSGYYTSNVYYFNSNTLIGYIENIDTNSWTLNDSNNNLVNNPNFEIKKDMATYYSCSKGIVTEYKVTIVDNKLNKELLKTYQNGINGYTVSGGC